MGKVHFRDEVEILYKLTDHVLNEKCRLSLKVYWTRLGSLYILDNNHHVN